jgi:16S rRNA (guanine966-N2)-methyltransferase
VRKAAPSPSRKAAPARALPRQLRIIGGQWRGRRLRFPEGDIRPTPDRVRETLFNWLQRRIAGAHCLDLFAGSGALGLEALSRGAARAVFVERDRNAAQALRATLAEWEGPLQPPQPPGPRNVTPRGAVHCTEALSYLRSALRSNAAPSPAFDVVFLDPPYAAVNGLAEVAALLAQGLLRPDAGIYVEHARRDALPALPATWREVRAGTAGEVGYHLFEASLFEATGRAGDEIQRGLSRDL